MRFEFEFRAEILDRWDFGVDGVVVCYMCQSSVPPFASDTLTLSSTYSQVDFLIEPRERKVSVVRLSYLGITLKLRQSCPGGCE